MDAERWRRAKDVLDRALDLPPGDRQAFVAAECVDDTALEAEVHELLRASQADADPLETPAMATALPAEADLEDRTGTEVGGYRLTRLIGSGGMGVVYEAERTGEVGGRVAVKLVKHGIDGDQLESRFNQERRILARLTHPNIAHFIDGGLTSSGRPFFVMEYVDGEPITRHCDRFALSLEARIRVFLQVLQAAAFAHRHLVVHRDIKPSNVLVTEDGRVKLLDFGVAKLLSREDTFDATLTRVGGRILTPSYSSPEQIRGEPVTTATDLYSLGVILYELLTGSRPFELDTVSLPEIQRVVSYDEPTRPSEAVTERREARVATRGLRRRLSGDLDAIVLKALRKEPERRYASAQELRDDLLRFLDGEPVLARRGTWSYTLGKTIRRHQTAFVGLGVLGVALAVGGLTVASQRAETHRQRALAEQRVEDVRSLVNTLVFDVHDQVARLPGSTEARRVILERAYEGLEAVEADVSDDPVLLMRLAETYRRLGDVQGRPLAPSLGDLTSARRSFQQGIALAESAIELRPGDIGFTRGLGLLHERYAAVLAFSGEVDEGFGHSERALEIYEAIAEAFPDSVRHQMTAAIGWINRSDYAGHPFYPNLGRTQEATAGYREVMARLERPPLAADDSPGTRRYRALTRERLARMLREQGELDESLREFRATLAAREALADEFPSDDAMERDVAVTHQNVCNLLTALNRFGEAEHSCDLAFDMYEARVRLDSVNFQNVMDMAEIHRSYEEMYRSAGENSRALPHLELVVEWADRALARDPSSVLGQRAKLDALLTRALMQARGPGPVAGLPEVRALAADMERAGTLSEYDAARGDSLEVLLGRE